MNISLVDTPETAAVKRRALAAFVIREFDRAKASHWQRKWCLMVGAANDVDALREWREMGFDGPPPTLPKTVDAIREYLSYGKVPGVEAAEQPLAARELALKAREEAREAFARRVSELHTEGLRWYR